MLKAINELNKAFIVATMQDITSCKFSIQRVVCKRVDILIAADIKSFIKLPHRRTQLEQQESYMEQITQLKNISFDYFICNFYM